MLSGNLRHVNGWCSSEFARIQLGDYRLNQRFIHTAELLLASPESSINQACISWSNSKGAYRLFDNEKVSSEEILHAHQESALLRIRNHKVVLAIQDTVYFNFDSDPEGYGAVKKRKFNEMLGVILHHTLATTTDGLPLGVLSQNFSYRNIGSKRKNHYEHQNIPFEDKESFRWVEALRESIRFENETTKIISVADRECDIFEFLQECNQLQASFVIRAAKDRALWNGKNKNETELRLWEAVSAAPIKGKYKLKISGQNGESDREAQIAVRYTEITIRPPSRRPGAKSEPLMPVKVTAILATEIDPPRNADPIEWLLLSDLKVKSFPDALEKIQWYKIRWQIEYYHKTIKSGFKVESSRLHTIERIYRYISLVSILAVRILALTHEARLNPNKSCEEVLSPVEWSALFAKVNRTTDIPKEPPNIKDAMIMIAKLGGYLNRKSDPPPGAIVIWRGWKRLSDVVDDWSLFLKKDVGKS
jgi:hypothetical protein